LVAISNQNPHKLPISQNLNTGFVERRKSGAHILPQILTHFEFNMGNGGYRRRRVMLG
jgi:hypothetical protein